jgi:hypothetical protein
VRASPRKSQQPGVDLRANNAGGLKSGDAMCVDVIAILTSGFTLAT